MKPKYIRVVSDLHLEQFADQRVEFLQQTFIPDDDRDKDSILILAGDISSKPLQLVAFLRVVEKLFLKVYYLPGNHEMYGHDMSVWAENLIIDMASGPLEDPKNIKTEIVTHDVRCQELENVRIIWGTLWADGGKTAAGKSAVGKGLRDFYVVRVNQEHLNQECATRLFTVEDMAALHRAQKAKIKEYVETPFDGITVVATHHMPSLQLCHPRFGDQINGGFASDCEDILVCATPPHIWIHGHTHDTGDNLMWNTRIICNPSGYYFETDKKYHNYKPMFIDLDNPLNNEK